MQEAHPNSGADVAGHCERFLVSLKSSDDGSLGRNRRIVGYKHDCYVQGTP